MSVLYMANIVPSRAVAWAMWEASDEATKLVFKEAFDSVLSSFEEPVFPPTDNSRAAYEAGYKAAIRAVLAYAPGGIPAKIYWEMNSEG